MSSITVALPLGSDEYFESTLQQLSSSALVKRILILHNSEYHPSHPKCEAMTVSSLASGETVSAILKKATTQFLLLVTQVQPFELGQFALKRFLTVAERTGAAMLYSDYHEVIDGVRRAHPVNDCQLGSVRDDFDFGSLWFLSVPQARSTLRRHGALATVNWAGLYDLRLKISIDHEILHIPELLYLKAQADDRIMGARQFDYVDPRNSEAQKEMEAVFTEHLKRIGAHLEPEFKPAPRSHIAFPVEASIIIPVRNREHTIGDAIGSVLQQQADFPFNILVVDNHSTDGTTAVVAEIAKKNPGVHHIIPERRDLGIGGCWNEAVFSDHCGRYAVQLDSDDLYSGPDTLQRVVDTFRGGDYAMVIGSYRLVNMNLEEIPPGLIDHREWTPENGRNNALRINGLGAPRGFDTAVLREAGFPNVSYGEDYAIALWLSREYQIGRIYDSIYLCRRWEGNSDAALPIEQANRHDFYKDRIRTMEIMARQRMIKSSRLRSRRNKSRPATDTEAESKVVESQSS